MSEPILDLSEIVGLYKEDARITVSRMREALDRWDEVKTGGPALLELRRMSHQLRGSGRTYGFRQVTRYCKAIENIAIKLEKNELLPEDRVRDSIRKKIELLRSAFEQP